MGKKMNSLYRIAVSICIIAASSLTDTYARAGNTSLPDSILTSQYIYRISVSEPERTLKLTDEIAQNVNKYYF